MSKYDVISDVIGKESQEIIHKLTEQLNIVFLEMYSNIDKNSHPLLKDFQTLEIHILQLQHILNLKFEMCKYMCKVYSRFGEKNFNEVEKALEEMIIPSFEKYTEGEEECSDELHKIRQRVYGHILRAIR